MFCVACCTSRCCPCVHLFTAITLVLLEETCASRGKRRRAISTKAVREYNQVVMDSHFPEGWLAPKQVTTQNAYIVGDTTFTNGTEVSPLLGESICHFVAPFLTGPTEISMSKTNSWDPTWYATSTLGTSTWEYIALIDQVLFLILYSLASGIWFFMFRYNRVFPTLCLDHQKNVVVCKSR